MLAKSIIKISNFIQKNVILRPLKTSSPGCCYNLSYSRHKYYPYRKLSIQKTTPWVIGFVVIVISEFYLIVIVEFSIKLVVIVMAIVN